jgi:hypothetical protein
MSDRRNGRGIGNSGYDVVAGRSGFIGFVVAAAFLAFVGGAVVVLADAYPGRVMRDAYRAGEALIAQRSESLDRFKTDQWNQARTAARGVTVCERDRAFSGYTLYTSGDGPYARLIAMDGSVVHEWSKPFSEIWNDGAAVKRPQPDELIYLRKASLLPNGDLLAIYEAAGDTPWGYGMVKLDRDSRVIWSYLDYTHHDFDVMPDGRILALTHAFTSEELEGFSELERPRLDDFLVILSPEGREEKRISLTHALQASRFDGLLHAIPFFALADPLHSNAVELIEPVNATNFPFGRPGQVLLSFREPGAIAVLDLDREEIVWATRGPWLGQHDPSLLPDGRILLFDNLGRFESGSTSQVIEFDPATLATTWRYAGTAERPLDSLIRANAERLPDGNTLITESNGGRLLEVTRDGTIVWEYVNPVRGGEGDGFIPVLSEGQRIDPAALDAAFLAILASADTGCSTAQAAATGGG